MSRGAAHKLATDGPSRIIGKILPPHRMSSLCKSLRRTSSSLVAEGTFSRRDIADTIPRREWQFSDRECANSYRHLRPNLQSARISKRSPRPEGRGFKTFDPPFRAGAIRPLQ